MGSANPVNIIHNQLGAGTGAPTADRSNRLGQHVSETVPGLTGQSDRASKSDNV